MHPLVFSIFLLSFVSVSTQRILESHSHFTVYIEFVFILQQCATSSIIRQYTLINIFKILNCALYEFIYYNIITITNVSDFPLS
jgi:hypothetical protein